MNVDNVIIEEQTKDGPYYFEYLVIYEPEDCILAGFDSYEDAELFIKALENHK